MPLVLCPLGVCAYIITAGWLKSTDCHDFHNDLFTGRARTGSGVSHMETYTVQLTSYMTYSLLGQCLELEQNELGKQIGQGVNRHTPLNCLSSKLDLSQRSFLYYDLKHLRMILGSFQDGLQVGNLLKIFNFIFICERWLQI